MINCLKFNHEGSLYFSLLHDSTTGGVLKLNFRQSHQYSGITQLILVIMNL
jgi:hypothetical protein